MRPEVTHFSPLAFGAVDPDGTWGGGRCVWELARAMAELVPTRLVTFGARARRIRAGRLEVRVLPVRGHWHDGEVNPLSERMALEAAAAPVIHAHQYRSAVTNVCLAAGRLAGRQVFCTDHGGASYNLADRFPLHRLLTGFLPVSRFSATLFPQLGVPRAILLGGADPALYSPGGAERRREVVFVGRLLPHKGVDVLIEALPPGVRLRVFGRPYDPGYRAVLARLAEGRDVVFEEDAPDDRVRAALRSARAAVLPSVHHSRYGPYAPYPELLGLALIEAMACGTPVVATRVGGMPEVVRDGETGLLVEPGDPTALGDALGVLLGDERRWRAYADAARADAADRLTWAAVAHRCLDAYRAP